MSKKKNIKSNEIEIKISSKKSNKEKTKKAVFLFEELNLKIKIFLVSICLWIIAVITTICFYDIFSAALIFLGSILILIHGLVVLLEYRRHRLLFINQLLYRFDSKNGSSFYDFPMPVVSCSGSGVVLWYNDKIKQSLNFDDDYIGYNFLNVIKQPLKNLCVETGVLIKYQNKDFRVYGNYFDKSNMYILLFEDVTNYISLKKEYNASKVCVLYVVIDNYREILMNKKDSEKSSIIGRVDDLIESFVEKNNGILQKYREDEFFIILKQENFDDIIQNKFQILQTVKDVIVNEKKCELTLSIGAGSETDDFVECQKFAFQALDMALGRGGDQAAVKTPTSFDFYGGNSKELYKSSRVKARVVAKALLELVKNASNIIIMGHKFGDLDSSGAAISLAIAMRKLNKTSFVAINKEQNLSKILFEKVEEAGYNDVVVDLNSAINLINFETLLIVVDTHNLNLLDSNKIYEACQTVVVIDHHRKAVDCIKNAVIFYHEPYASSTCELVCELIQQFGYEKLIGAVEAQALLAGIMLDTKNFAIKVGVRTFEAAAYLKRLGADTVEVRKLFASSITAYQKKTRTVMGAEIYKNCAIVVSEFKTDDMRTISPQAADELLGIIGVEASFVIYELDGKVFITARSLGRFNVQVIMERFKGGGHQMQAACQLEGVDLSDAYDMLTKAIDEWQN